MVTGGATVGARVSLGANGGEGEEVPEFVEAEGEREWMATGGATVGARMPLVPMKGKAKKCSRK
jgi:hypothetical protein